MTDPRRRPVPFTRAEQAAEAVAAAVGGAPVRRRTIRLGRLAVTVTWEPRRA